MRNHNNMKSILCLCFGFRTSGGRLHLLQDVGKIPLADATLIEEPNESDKEDESEQIISIRTFLSNKIID